MVAGLPDAKTSIRIDFPDCGVVGEEVEDEEEEETIAVLAVVAAVVLAEELGMLLAVVVAIVVVEVVLKVVVEVSMVSGRGLSSGTTSTCRTKSGGGGSGVDGDGGEVVKFSIGVDDEPQIEGFTSVVTISSSSSFGTPGTVTDVLITSSTT